MTNRVIICGYPKSGNTWLTRLTAEIIGCPSVGFWCAPLDNDESIEGQDRKSDFACFKAHHSLSQLRETFKIYGNGTEKFIYVYRDPRDVIVSASRYFWTSPRYKRIHAISGLVPHARGLYYKILDSSAHRVRVFTQGLVEGTQEGAWLGKPWKEHVEEYLGSGDCLAVSYDALKKDPLKQAKALCDFLSLSRSDDELKTAIHKQSFEVRKKEFEKSGNTRQASFLRKGKVGSWKEVLEESELKFLDKRIGEFMRSLGYD